MSDATSDSMNNNDHQPDWHDAHDTKKTPFVPDIDADELCIAAMLRACADGELCPEGCERLKAYLAEHPEAQAQVNFEKELKGCCERVMKKSPCPDALRAKIEAIAAASMAESSMEASNAVTREKSFWQRSPMMSAMAAVLVLAGGGLIWQSSSLITKGSGIGIVETTPVEYAERVGNFVAREHKRCCEERAADKKLVHNDIDQATAYFSEKFEKPIVTPASMDTDPLAHQIRFYGGGDCHLPATDGSGHMRFDAVNSNGERVSLSLFIAPDPGFLEMEEGVTYLLNSTQCAEQGASLFAWVHDGVMYLLVSEADESMCAPVRAMMNAPDEIRPL
ncbi:MAG: hypothetical protein JJ974_03200 [Phycisphaerales bacterium]|nr:hypothetical protein [Phycisphaerales bacterium]